MQSPLPYQDIKPVGAADFYFVINATFSFIAQRLGLAALRDYWTALGREYFAPVSRRWQSRGLAGVAEYWRAFFAAEPGAEVEVIEASESVTLEVRTCPAIRHLREHHRPIVPCFCQHCYFVGDAMAASAGLKLRVHGGNGSCRQTVFRKDAGVPDQDLAHIKEAT